MNNLLKTYFRENTHEVTPIEEMFRTSGSEQLIYWGEMPDDKEAYTWREYHRGVYRNQPCFVKRILNADAEYLPIYQFIEGQAEKLLSLQEFPFVPRLFFYTPDAIVTSFCKGKTIKQMWYEGTLSVEFLETFLPPVINAVDMIRKELAVNGDIYDLSLNNLMVYIPPEDSDDAHSFQFVDFDKAVNYNPLCQFLLQLIVLAKGDWGYDDNGKMIPIQE